MKNHLLCMLLLAVPAVPVTASEELPALALLADVPSVSVSPQPSERHFFELPSLQYGFQVKAQCHAGWHAESLLLNVADTRAVRGKADLGATQSLQIQLQVPARQIAPLALRDFCVIDEAEEGSSPEGEERQEPVRSLRVGAALSAHASLHCSREDEHRTVYTSQPLDVTLLCESE